MAVQTIPEKHDIRSTKPKEEEKKKGKTSLSLRGTGDTYYCIQKKWLPYWLLPSVSSFSL